MKLLGILAKSFALLLPAVAPGFAAEADDTAPPPPPLQIINGRSHVIDIFWRTSDRARVAHDAVAASQATVITSTIGHRFSIVGRDHRTEALVNSEAPVPGFRFDPPGPNRVPAIFAQSIRAQGFPVVASARVNPSVPKEAAHLVDRMLAKRPDVRTAMIRSVPRLSTLAHDRFTTDLTQRAHRTPQDFRDARARGMGGGVTDPFGSCAEENVLGYPRDPDATESLVLHEFAHTLHRRGLLNVNPTSDRRLKKNGGDAMAAGLWQGKYASGNHHEYFAQGVPSWFDHHRENHHDHNHVNTRAELPAYDPGLAAICRAVFGDPGRHYPKPVTRFTGHLAGDDPTTAPTFVRPERLKTTREEIRAQAKARQPAGRPAQRSQS